MQILLFFLFSFPIRPREDQPVESVPVSVLELRAMRTVFLLGIALKTDRKES